MKIGNKEFDLSSHCYIMGILNVTPDSFSDGGSYENMDDIRRRVSGMERTSLISEGNPPGRDM